MLNLILVVLASVFIIFNTFRVIEFINAKDDIKITDKNLNRVIISIIASLFIGILYIKYNLSIVFIKCFILMIYLTITGYIDHYTKSVYAFISYTFLGIGLIIMGVNVYYGADIFSYLIIISSILIICFNIAVLGLIGWGDVEVLVITALYIGSFVSLMNIFIAFSLAGVVAAYRLATKKIRIGDRGALCPYIAISTCIILFIL